MFAFGFRILLDFRGMVTARHLSIDIQARIQSEAAAAHFTRKYMILQYICDLMATPWELRVWFPATPNASITVSDIARAVM